MSLSNNSLPTVQRQRFSVAITTESYQQLIKNSIADPKRRDRFIGAITSAVAVSPALQSCTPSTIIAGALLGEALNLSPSPQLGQYYLVPFDVVVKDKNGKTVYQTDANGNLLKDEYGKSIPLKEKRAQFVLGYHGYIQLALRSGAYKDLDVIEIREGEYLGKDGGTGKPRFKFIEDDELREELPVVGYMAYFEYQNGFRKSIYWSKEKMMIHADRYSPAFSKETYQKIQRNEISSRDMWKYSSYWYKDFDGMARKTMLRQLISKWGIMSTDMQEAIENDQQFADLTDNGNLDFVDESEVQPVIELERSEEQPDPEDPSFESNDPMEDTSYPDQETIGFEDL